MKNKTVLDKQKELELQISKLQIELNELKRKEETLDFIKWFRDVLLDDKCDIILQGHTEWQFHEKYLMKDIKYEYRSTIAESLEEIIKEHLLDKLLSATLKKLETGKEKI